MKRATLVCLILLFASALVAVAEEYSDHEEEYPEHKEEYPEHKEEYPEAKEEYPEHKEEYPEHKEEYPEKKEEYPEHKEEYPEHKEEYPEHKEEYPEDKEDSKPKPYKPKPKPKKVKCQEKYSPCYHKDLYCPDSCPRSCSADCGSCQAVCDAVYTPPLPPPTTPYPPSSSSPKHVRCMNKKYPTCYYRQLTCPADCPDTCEVDCVTCSPVCNCNKPGAVCQDPKFIGADGITFYFHGKKDQDFCLVTDSNLHMNAHFIGRRNANMGRDFTWVQSLGIMFDDHKLYLGALKTATWNDATDRLSLAFDGQPISLPESEGSSWQSPAGGVTITRSKATNTVEIVAEGKFKIKAAVVPITEKDSMIHKYGITQEDCFAHLDLSFKFYSLSGDVNGVLGQTYASNYVSRVKMGVAMPVLGGEKEFSSTSLFATDCAVARFTGNSNGNSAEGIEFADLNCATGLSGPGVVCKR